MSRFPFATNLIALICATVILQPLAAFTDDATATQAKPAIETPSLEVIEQVQARLDTFKVRDDGKHHTPRSGEARNEKQRKLLEESVAALDAKQIQEFTILRLQGLVLSEEDLRIISQLKNIRLVSFQKCTITAEGFAHLANAWHDSIEQLTLSYVDVAGGGSIADSASKLSKLELLTLNKTSGIGIDVVRAMSKLPIEAIDMNRPSAELKPEELFDVLATEFKSLRKLDLHHWQKHDQIRAAFRAKRPEVGKGKVRDRVFGILTSRYY